MLLRSECKSVRNSPTDPRKDGGGDAPAARTEISCSSWRHRGGAGGSLQPAERNIPEWISTTANCGVLCQNRYPHCSTWRIPCQRWWQVLKEAAGHGGAHDGALKNCAEEGASEMNWLKFMGWPQAPFPILSAPCRGRKEWEWRNEFEPGKKSEG